MTDAGRKVLDDALALPTQDRARIAAALLVSLEEQGDEDTSCACATD